MTLEELDRRWAAMYRLAYAYRHDWQKHAELQATCDRLALELRARKAAR